MTEGGCGLTSPGSGKTTASACPASTSAINLLVSSRAREKSECLSSSPSLPSAVELSIPHWLMQSLTRLVSSLPCSCSWKMNSRDLTTMSTSGRLNELTEVAESRILSLTRMEG